MLVKDFQVSFLSSGIGPSNLSFNKQAVVLQGFLRGL